MFDAAGFRDLVSGRRQGFPAVALRGMLRLGEFPYTWVVRRRNRGFETGRRHAISVGVPVISVGNLTLGGTGKTPMVEWISRWLLECEVRIALVSRGYGSNSGLANDEARELAQKLPSVPHVQNPDRVAAAKMAIEQFGSQVIVLDDGFQHRRIARNLDIVLIDALEPFGFGHVFPRGTLREPVEGLQRADVVVLSRADMADAVSRQKIRDVVQKLAPRSVWAECRHAAVKLISVDGVTEPISHLAGKSVAAFCGIGNPAGFRHTLEACGYNIAAWREFPDHHDYGANDLVQLSGWARAAQVELAVCTHKDLVKLSTSELGGKPLRAISIGIQFLAGQQELESRLQELLQSSNMSHNQQRTNDE